MAKPIIELLNNLRVTSYYFVPQKNRSGNYVDLHGNLLATSAILILVKICGRKKGISYLIEMFRYLSRPIFSQFWTILTRRLKFLESMHEICDYEYFQALEEFWNVWSGLKFSSKTVTYFSRTLLFSIFYCYKLFFMDMFLLMVNMGIYM